MIKVNYYQFKNRSTEKKYTWAYKIETGKKKSIQCPQCRKMIVEYIGPIGVSVEGGTEYPDILGCGEYPLLIVSQNVISAWEAGGIDGYQKIPVRIINVTSQSLRGTSTPGYFLIDIQGRCNVNLSASGLGDIKICKGCEQPIYFDPFKLTGYEIYHDSYSGHHLFRDVRLFPNVYFCTEKVLRIAGKYSLSNFYFRKYDEPYDFGNAGIDYHNLD